MREWLSRRLNAIWYDGGAGRLLLKPLSVLYGYITNRRKARYRDGHAPSYKLPVPVIVVGNITAGGTGKTPVVIWLTNELTAAGLQPAVISRGYGSRPGTGVCRVSKETSAAQAGDEPVLIARRTTANVYVDTNRVEAAQAAIADGASVIIADDGLQHYRLQRDFEIAVVDAARGFGNGELMPAGPLRESVARLDEVNLTLWHDSGSTEKTHAAERLAFTLGGHTLSALDRDATMSLAAAAEYDWVAMAAIGHPARFFAELARYGLRCENVALPDHASADVYPIERYRGRKILVTEKDAVKLHGRSSDIWTLPVEVMMPEDQARAITTEILACCQKELESGSHE